MSFIDDIINFVPGGNAVRDAVASVAGEIGDRAKTPLGSAILSVMASSLFVPLSQAKIPFSASGMQTVGPQIASVVFALPGVVAGDPFVESYTRELGTRVKETIRILSGRLGQQVAENVASEFTAQVQVLLNDPQFRSALVTAKSAIGDVSESKIFTRLVQLGITPSTIAKTFRVRPDAAAAAINGFFQKSVFPVNGGNYDLQTGEPEVPFVPNKPPPVVVSPIAIPSSLSAAKAALFLSLQEAAQRTSATLPDLSARLQIEATNLAAGRPSFQSVNALSAELRSRASTNPGAIESANNLDSLSRAALVATAAKPPVSVQVNGRTVLLEGERASRGFLGQALILLALTAPAWGVAVLRSRGR